MQYLHMYWKHSDHFQSNKWTKNMEINLCRFDRTVCPLSPQVEQKGLGRILATST